MANHKNAALNLKKKGAQANPNGRPKKGYSITEWFKEMFSSKPEVKDAIGKAIIKKALEGDTAAQRLVWNYMDGLPVQDITSKGEKLDTLNGLLATLNSGNAEETKSAAD